MSTIKQKVLQLIQATDNEELLQLIKADIEFFSGKEKDVIDELDGKTVAKVE